MPKGKGKKRAATDSQEAATAAKDCCIWSLDDEKKIVEYAVLQKAKGGDGMNFTKSFWITAAAEMATRPCPDDKKDVSVGLLFNPDLGANIGEESETMWADFIKHNPKAKPLKNKGWPRSLVGFHASTSLAANASTPTATGSEITHTTSADASADPMLSLESTLNQVKFHDLDDIEMSSTHDIPPVTAPISPVTPRGFNAAIQPFVAPSMSTPASSTAVKHKAEGDDNGQHESHPPHSSKGKSAAGSSKLQRLSMPLALEELGGKVVDSITSTTSALQDTIAGHIMEPVPSHKQCAMLQVQEEKDLDDYDAVAMINLFQFDVTIADAYNNITCSDNYQQLIMWSFVGDKNYNISLLDISHSYSAMENKFTSGIVPIRGLKTNSLLLRISQ
ncbi:hypothetical protein F4604DRAFT_1974037 [Suillus subluteus]|nr:hypothetical protein F4604DRAFT_1974037 [Suillus subluteus]